MLKREVVWKKLSGDVFRKPNFPLLLSILLGAGAHVFCCFYTAMFTSLVGAYSPINLPLQISLLTAVFPFYSAVNGYLAARIYKFFNGTNWILLSLLSSSFLPLFLAGNLFVIDVCEFIETKRASMVPISDILVLVVLWLSLNVPLTLLGCFIGFSR